MYDFIFIHLHKIQVRSSSTLINDRFAKEYFILVRNLALIYLFLIF